MAREISAGGIVVRKRGGVWWMAVIHPPTDHARLGTAPAKGVRRKSTRKPLLALPKGIVDPGENPVQTAVREVREETGVTAEPIVKLGDSKYVYVRTWGDGARVFKIVSFYLMRYRSGRINDVSPAMRVEVARARWIRLDTAASLLAYGGEKQMARRGLEYVLDHPEI